MKNYFNQSRILTSIAILFFLSNCNLEKQSVREVNPNLPNQYKEVSDAVNIKNIKWKEYFDDKNLNTLIETALENNQELNILNQEIEIAKNEIMARKGEYLPSVNVIVGAGLEKEGLYTRKGAVDEQLFIKENKKFPEPLGDYIIGGVATWELDVWKKLRNAKQVAYLDYLASQEGKNFMITQLVAEISSDYYELLALDNLLETIEQNIAIQSNALKVVKIQKEAARVNQLAVNRFEAQLRNTENLQYKIKQKITETENHLRYLLGKSDQKIEREANNFMQIKLDSLQAGIPSQLLANRPDIRQAELQLSAAKLDVKVAKARFYPKLDIRAGLGFNSFDPSFLFNPESLLYNAAGDLMAPLINQNAIKAAYYSANAEQLKSVIQYEQIVLDAYLDVMNQLTKINNYTESYKTKEREVEVLSKSIGISNELFNAARADYSEVLFTQREALDAKLELIEIQAQILSCKVQLYRALGGG